MNKVYYLVDMNAFFISLEESRDDSLKGKPCAVAGNPKTRTGIILTANYIARSYGVKTAMTIYEALKLCPDLKLVKPDHDFYARKSKEIMNQLSKLTPNIEVNSIDEAWLDMTSYDVLKGKSHIEIANEIKNDIAKNNGVTCSIGIGHTRFLAKMASEIHKPNGVFYLNKDNFKTHLWPLPLRKMYGCGKKTASKLEVLGINTIGELKDEDPSILVSYLGKMGQLLYLRANGYDDGNVIASKEKMKSISKETTLADDEYDKNRLYEAIKPLILQVSKKIRENGYQYDTVFIVTKDVDFKRKTKQKTVIITDSTVVLKKVSHEILMSMQIIKPIRLIGVGVRGIVEEHVSQLNLFDDYKEDKVHKILDNINSKFGANIVKRGVKAKDENRR